MFIGKCKQCGKEKAYKYKSFVKDFCSHKCSNQYKWENVRQKGKKTKLICKYCNKEFELLSSVLKARKKVLYCSQKCFFEEIKIKKKECKHCKKTFIPKSSRNEFCSRECACESRKTGYNEKEYMKKYLKEYNQKNKDKINAIKREYNKKPHAKISKFIVYLKRKSNGKSITKEDYKLLIKNSKGKCYWCGQDLNDKFHIDHYYPLSKGGTSDFLNLVVSCPTCNIKKGATMPSVFASKINFRNLL